MGKNESSTFAIKKSGLSSTKLRGLSSVLDCHSAENLVWPRFVFTTTRQRWHAAALRSHLIVEQQSRRAGAYLSDGISRLNPNFAHSSNRPQYYTYIHACAHDKYVFKPSLQCAESYSKNRGPLNRTVIQNNGKICLHCAATWHHRRAAAAESSQRRPCENLLPWYSAYLISLSKYE